MSQKWYYVALGERHGPVSEDELKALAESKELLPDDMVWKSGEPEWIAARSVPGLFDSPPPVPQDRVEVLKQWAKRNRWALAVAAIILSFLLLDGVGSSRLESSAKPLVNEILRQNHGSRAASCVKVRITEPLGDEHYRAVAYLDNGNELRVMIRRSGDTIYVSVAP